MIYLKNISDPQVVRIPASGPKADGVVTLEMVNTIDRGPAFVFEFDQAVYLVDADGAYVHDADDLQETPDEATEEETEVENVNSSSVSAETIRSCSRAVTTP